MLRASLFEQLLCLEPRTSHLGTWIQAPALRPAHCVNSGGRAPSPVWASAFLAVY